MRNTCRSAFEEKSNSSTKAEQQLHQTRQQLEEIQQALKVKQEEAQGLAGQVEQLQSEYQQQANKLQALQRDLDASQEVEAEVNRNKQQHKLQGRLQPKCWSSKIAAGGISKLQGAA